ncbi:MAG: hypothetical protein GXO24_04345 [Chlorobi bacterium]|nr:hypothetical protein [Chlorobiota bacterium]
MKKYFLIFAFLLTGFAHAQGFYTDKAAVTLGKKLNAHCCWAGQYRITGDVGLMMNKISYEKTPGQYTDFMRVASTYSLGIKFYKELQIRLSFMADHHHNADQPQWLSNLYYAVGWYNWRNKTFSYGYENYQPNRFDGSYDWLQNMKRGFFFVSYNYQLIPPQSRFKLDPTTQIHLSPFIRYQPEYTDRYGLQVLGHHKWILGTAARYVIWKNIYAEGAVYFYPQKNTVLPWDPDYTYGFGLFDWRNFSLNISYGNWIANRFPWNRKEMKNDFTNGEFRINFHVIW